ncbi:MAG TPA: nucleotidyltransferase domain-containing protein [Chloroflexi bacterium]|nr:nucleotidyltransferase domain-containing protein [Chloroflexota bacterium]
MTRKIDIQPHHLATVKAILKDLAPETEARIFGSRVRGTAAAYSDLDMVLVAAAKIDRKMLYRLEDAFSQSALPFRVDVLDWHRISSSFRQVIERAYVVIQQGCYDNVHQKS